MSYARITLDFIIPIGIVLIVFIVVATAAVVVIISLINRIIIMSNSIVRIITMLFPSWRDRSLARVGGKATTGIARGAMSQGLPPD